ncbi:NADPH-dependent FMN reductase [Periweissella beninensis]|uniref:NADPH-dependent FMN reductase n=1 Tax=Periweissella beninensis TaxID=504936 RepID=UPI0021A78265|nr:NAD(P)H-dependent oxidoreductase [Periweissella beninensis]MCT4395553.1 NADPH-dependent oxidoreductase [Periweissella beninensis]
MKLVGIVGSAAKESYNRFLLKYIATEFGDLFELELLEVKDLPLFDQEATVTADSLINKYSDTIKAADGVIIATPEHNHTVGAALKSALEWLSYDVHPFNDKPVMVIGTSYYDQGTSRAQLHLRQILEAPGVNAITFPGHEFLLANAKDAFDEAHEIKDYRTVKFLEANLKEFKKFVKLIQRMDDEELVDDVAGASENADTAKAPVAPVTDKEIAADNEVDDVASASVDE